MGFSRPGYWSGWPFPSPEDLPNSGIEPNSLAWQADSLPAEPQVQFSSSVVSDSLQPMNRRTPGLPVHHKLLELTQTHFHRVGNAIQPSHPLLSPPPPAPNLFQHQGLFQ